MKRIRYNPNDPVALRAEAERLRKLADSYSSTSYHASDNAPGSFVTGRSGRTRAMNRRTDQALNRTIKYAKMAVETREKAAALEIKARYIENTPERLELERQIAHKEMLARKAEVARPLVNDPAASFHMTSEKWNKTPRDYKGVIVEDKYRERSIMNKSALERVFLTDKKTVLRIV